MSFSTAISGVNAATTDLNVISNNIANASTVGFKAGSAEFAEVYASSLLGSGAAQTGQGVVVTEIRQDFSQGNIEFTSNSLDLAISGNGFFVLETNDGGQTFTRAGGFRVDREGFLTNAQGLRLQGFQATESGEITGELDDLFIDTTLIEPAATAETTITQNLDSRDLALRDAAAAATPSFDPADPLTYNSSTSTTIYDSLGNPHVLNVYYVKEPDLTALQDPAGGAALDATAAPVSAQSAYAVYITVDGEQLYDNAGTTTDVSDDLPNGYLLFGSNGQLIDGSATDPAFNPQVSSLAYIPKDANGNPNGATGGNPALANVLQLDLASSTQFGTNFAVSSIVQDGFGAGQLIAFEIDESGTAFARFTNGQSRSIGQVALANFQNNNGLSPAGDTNFQETFASGAPTIGAPGSGGRGVVQSSAVESANVDITSELVNLIIAQRNFSANAQVISANDQLTQTIINLR
jgi:flagellar hook protein FlgE